MSQKLKEISEMFLETKFEVTNSIESWQNFLTTASRLPKYNFDDQLLIYAQKPDAVACASMNIWNGKMNRWVKSGSKGIALIHKSVGNRPYIEYVFDLDDTRKLQKAKTPFIWEMKSELVPNIIEKLSDMYGEIDNNGDFVSTILEYCERATGEHYREYLHDLNYDLEDSFLEGLDNLNVDLMFKSAITSSTQYMVLSRMGLDPMEYMESEDFKDVFNFNTVEILSHLGTALNTVSSEILVAIGDVARDYEIENIKEEIDNEQELDLPTDRRLPNTERESSDRGIARDSGQVWNVERNVSNGTQERDLHSNDDARHVMGSHSGHRQDSTVRDGQIDGRNDDISRSNRGTESQRPNIMGTNDEQHQGSSRGNSVEGTDLQLKDLLSHDIHFKNKIEDIFIYFSHNAEDNQRSNYIKNSFNTDYTEVSLKGERFGYKANDDELTVWKGSYLSREQENKLSWSAVAEIFSNEVIPDFIERQKERQAEISIFPTVAEQIENIIEAKAEEKTSVFSFAENSAIPNELVDKIIAAGSNERIDTTLIAGYMAYNFEVSENADFLKTHYGVGGKGFEIDGNKYSLGWNEEGLQIAKGKSVQYASNKVSFSWDEVAIKIRELLDKGEYIPKEGLDVSKDVYLDNEATLFSYMYRDKVDDYKNEILESIKTSKGYLDYVKEIKSHFLDKEKMANIIVGLEQMEQDHKNAEDGIMRFKFNNPTKTLNRVKNLINEPIEFKANENFKNIEPNFVTEDELDIVYKSRNTGINTSNIDTYAFFKQGHNQKDKADFLKDRYGLSGTGVSNINTSHSSKGTVYSKGGIMNPYAQVTENWGQVAKRIDTMIAENRYLNKAELEHIPSYEKLQIAKRIYNFYSYAPKDIEKPFGNLDVDYSYYNNNYEKTVDNIVESLEKPEFINNVLESMENAISHTLSDERGFEIMEKIISDVKAFHDGTYSIFNKVEFKKAQSIDEDDDEIEEENSIEEMAKKLERKRNNLKTVQDDSGQLTIDFFGTSNKEVAEILEENGLMVSEELIEYAKEDLEQATAADIAKKVEDIIAQDENEILPTVKTIMYSDIASEFVKSQRDFVDSEMKVYINEDGKEFAFGYGSLGNGTTVWNYLDTFQNDYKTIGHISDSGVVSWIDDEVPLEGKREIERSAKRNVERNVVPNEQEPKIEEDSQLKDSNYIESYINFKAENPTDVVGVVSSNNVLFYGDDAEIVAPKLNIRPIERDIEELGYTKVVTLDVSNLENYVDNLSENGIDFKIINNGNIIKENKAKDYIPVGMELDINGRKFEIDSVNYDFNEVSLRDITFRNNTGFPSLDTRPVNEVYEQGIFRSEKVATVRAFVEEKQALDKEIINEKIEVKSIENTQNEEIELNFFNLVSEDKTAVKPVIESKLPKVNFKITDNEIGVGTQKEKFENNINAIKTLQLVENEQRLATPEEQVILSKYVGWGGLSDAFDDSKSNWANEFTTLKNLLSEDEYKSARASTLNAHYTPPIVINSMYQALEQMGLPKDINIIDPALGTGHFIGMLPENMKGNKIYGTELDSLTGRIAKQLYPNADIQIKGFEKAEFSDNFFDVAVGNVPFGNYKLNDRRYDKQNFLIHDYFFAKTLDKVRAGGVVAFITSKGTLDKQSDEVRKYLAQRADLLGAIRLPNTAFKANAGTEVTSDIIFLQKRDHAPEIMPSWVNVSENSEGISMNQYFIDNPQMVMGTMEMVSGPFGMESTCKARTETPLVEQLKVANSFITKPDVELLNQVSHSEETVKDKSIPATPDVKNFSYTIIDDKAYYRENSRMNEVNLSSNALDRMKELIKIRDKTRDIIQLQLDECDDVTLSVAQNELNTLYDNYNKNYGLINSKGSKSAFVNDVSYPLLCSLEKLDEDGNLAGKADMFTKRTIKQTAKITSVDTPTEALAVSIAEKAKVDIEFMADLLGGIDKADVVINELKGIIFKDPFADENDKFAGWQAADEYLSGNVREKLDLAKVKAETNPNFEINVEMLTKVQPKDLLATEIDVRIGATWIDPKYYSQFIFELLDTPRYMQNNKIEVRYSKHTGEWNITGKSEDRANPKSIGTFGTKRRNAYSIIEDSLNLRDTRIYDTIVDEEGREKRVLNGKETTLVQQKQEAIGEAFKEWIWKDPERREVLAKEYNRIYNATRPREFDGQHIKFDGMSPLIKLNPHQCNAVARTLYGDNTLLAHCVGAGKTFTMIASAMESKRLGLSQKSLFVVPNHLTEQMGSDIYELYPGAKILVATKKDFEPANRKEFCSRIATGDFDIVVIGHSQFEKIPLSHARQEAIIKNQIEDIMVAIQEAKDQDGTRYTVKQLEKTQKSLETRLEKLASQEKKDAVVTFEELGVDKLFVDEAHLFKNCAKRCA